MSNNAFTSTCSTMFKSTLSNVAKSIKCRKKKAKKKGIFETKAKKDHYFKAYVKRAIRTAQLDPPALKVERTHASRLFFF